MNRPTVSLVNSTLGRSQVLERLFQSLELQSYKDFEVIVVDQNPDDRLAQILLPGRWSFPVLHLARPNTKGLSRGRNIGWKAAKGSLITFPDDDGWYPSWFLKNAIAILNKNNADIVCGRAADDKGRNVNARFSSHAHVINKRNVWTGQSESFSLMKRSALEAVGGFDEDIGVGASTPWQAAEGPDLIIRALEKGKVCCFDPALYGYHEAFNISHPDEKMLRKVRAYGRGMGFVLRRHYGSVLCILYWAMRSIFNVVRFSLIGQFGKARVYSGMTIGRIEGWARRTIGKPFQI
jgi:glycosyltransferase involved in cell wall biosynthesis